VHRAKRGYRCQYTAAVGGLPLVWGPLPAEVMEGCMSLWPRADPLLRNTLAGTVLAFLLFNRPGAASHMRAMDVQPTPSGLEVQVLDYKMGVMKDGERIAYTVPAFPAGWVADPVLRLVCEY